MELFTPQQIKNLNELELLVYQYIIEHPNTVPFMRIRELAAEAHVSTTTVLHLSLIHILPVRSARLSLHLSLSHPCRIPRSRFCELFWPWLLRVARCRLRVVLSTWWLLRRRS